MPDNDSGQAQTRIAKNTVVAIDYTLRSDAGEVIDSSQGREPLHYLHGHGNLISGLERELEGKTSGDTLKVRIVPSEGYGERDDNLVAEVDRAQFGGISDIEVGMQFRAQTNQGPRTVRIAKVEGDTITVDGNHPLAGEHLNFDVDVRSVRKATREEIAHGHVHGPGGHQH